MAEELVPSAMVAGGSALARDADGQVVFVNGALPGERVRVEIETERRGYRTARLLDVLEPSPDRVVPPCPELARGCGACQWQHISVDAQRTLKRDIVVDALGAHREDPRAGRHRAADDRAAAVVVPHDRARGGGEGAGRLPPRAFARLARGRQLHGHASAARAVDDRGEVPGRERGAPAVREPHR